MKGRQMPNNEIVTVIDGEARTTSLIIADGAKAQHASVIRLIRDNLADLEEFGQVGFEIRPGYNNAQVQVAHLNEQQTTLILTYMRNNEVVRSFKKALVKAFYELASQRALPQSYGEALRELAATVEQREALEARITADAPKVSYVDRFVADADLRLLRNVAKTIGIGETELRDQLIARRWIYVESMTRWSHTEGRKVAIHRYSPYADKARYFFPEPNHQAPRFKGEVMHTLKVTPSGAEAIARFFTPSTPAEVHS
jgi:phage regulator Rha-like protein